MGEDQHFLPHSLYSPHLSLPVFLSGLSHYHLLGSHRVVREKTVVPSDRGGQIYQNIPCKIEHLVHVSSRAIDAFLLWFDYPIFLAPLPHKSPPFPVFSFYQSLTRKTLLSGTLDVDKICLLSDLAYFNPTMQQ